MGDGSRALPEWKSRKHQTFYLYDFTEPDAEDRARFRTQALTPEERETLWRRRAVVHAVFQRWDDHKRFSMRDGWRVISGWTSGLFGVTRKPLNLYGWAYSRERGRAGPGQDFVTSAEELFVDPSHLREDAVPVDDSVRCQEMTRARFFEKVLGELGAQLPPRGPCPLFDAWAEPEDLERFDILLAEPSSVHPESVFGHALMQPMRKKPRPPSKQEVFEIAAVVDGNDGLPAFIIKGTTGGYLSTFGRTTMGHLRQRYLELDQRTMRRFQLHLTPEERVQVLERMWELERRGYLPYYFISDNCASLLLFLLGPAIGAEAAAFRYPWAMPTVVLDELARTKRTVTFADGTKVQVPLLTLEPTHELADIEKAFAADRARPKTLRALRRALGAEDRDALEAWMTGVMAKAPATRMETYEQTSALIEGALARAAPEARAAQQALWARLLDEQLAMERYASDRARRQAAAVDDARIIREEVKPPSAQDLLQFRQQLFRREEPERPRLELRQTIELEWLWSTAPRRPPTRREEETLARASVTHDAFRILATAAASLRAGGTVPMTPPPPPPDREAHMRGQGKPGTRGSGHARLVLQPTATATASGSPAGPDAKVSPGLRLRLAFLGEHLGDQRDRGFGPRTEVRAFDFSGILEWNDQGIYRPWADVVLFSFRTTTREPVLMRRSLLDAIGRGGGLEYRRRLHGLWRDVIDVHSEAIIPLLRLDGTDGKLWALGVGGTGQWRFHRGERGFGVGPRLQWLSRMPLGRRGGTSLRLEASYAPLWSLHHPLEHQAVGKLRMEVPARFAGVDFLFAPTAGMEVDHRAGASRVRGTFGFGFESL